MLWNVAGSNERALAALSPPTLLRRRRTQACRIQPERFLQTRPIADDLSCGLRQGPEEHRCKGQLWRGESLNFLVAPVAKKLAGAANLRNAASRQSLATSQVVSSSTLRFACAFLRVA